MKTRKDLDRWINGAYSDSSNVSSRMRLADNSTLCLWEGQTDDCRKNDPDAFPFKGASDTRVKLVSSKLSAVDSICDVSFNRGVFDFGVGVNGDDVDWAKRMNNLIRWQIGQMNPRATTERDLARHWRNRYGFSFIGVSWDYRESMSKENMSVVKFFRYIDDPAIIDYAVGVGQEADEYDALLSFIDQAETIMELSSSGPNSDAGEEFFSVYNTVKDLFDLINNENRGKELYKRVRDAFPDMSQEAIRNEVERLRVDGEGCFPVPIVSRNQPRWQAMKYLEHIVFPPQTVHLESAEFVAVRQIMNASEVDATDWNDSFKEAVKQTKGVFKHEYKTLNTNSSSWEKCSADEIEVFFVYYYDKDSHGTRSLFECVYSPHLSLPEYEDLFGKHGLLDMPTPSYPFVSFVFDRREEAIVDNKGIPELIFELQAQIKKERDSRMDASSLQNYPMFERDPRARDKPMVIGPGKEIVGPYGTFKWHYLQNNVGQYQSRSDEEILHIDADKLAGTWNDKIPQEETYTRQECLSRQWLDQMAEVIKLTFKLDQHYLPDDTVVRVVGTLSRPFRISRQDIQGDFDFRISFDAKEINPQYRDEKLSRMVDILKLDTSGVFDRTRVVEVLTRSVDPNWADYMLVDNQSASNREIDSEKDNIALIMSGQEPRKSEGGNYQLRLKVITDTLQVSPIIANAYNSNETIKALFDNRIQHLEFMIQQQENAYIGRVGVGDVIPV